MRNEEAGGAARSFLSVLLLSTSPRTDGGWTVFKSTYPGSELAARPEMWGPRSNVVYNQLHLAHVRHRPGRRISPTDNLAGAERQNARCRALEVLPTMW